MSIEGLTPIVLESMKGTQTLPDAQDVPEGWSTDSKNVEFRLGTGVSSRPGRSLFAVLGGGVYIMSMAEFSLLDGQTRRVLILDSSGSFWKELGDQTLALIESGIGINQHFDMVTAFGREYIAQSDGKLGTAPPRYYDDASFFRVSQGGPGAPPSATDGAVGGVVDEGWRFVRIIFELADGYRTAPGPAVKLRTSGLRHLNVFQIPLGPSNVVRRIIAVSAAVSDDVEASISADAVRYFFIPDSNMVINDNTTFFTAGSPRVLDFSDAELTAAEDVTDLLFLVVLPEQAGVTVYNNRLVWWGGVNNQYRVADTGLLNLDFDGGYQQPVGVFGKVPNGWEGIHPGCDVESPVSGATGGVFRIIADGVSQRGTIQNTVQGPALNAFVRPNTAYGGRMRLRKSPGLTQGTVSMYFLTASGAAIGQAFGVLTVDSADLTTDWQTFAGPVFPSTGVFPTDLVFRISGGKGGDGQTTVLAPAGEYIEIDFVNFYPLNQPATPSLLYVSDAGLPGNYSDNGLIQVAENDGQAIRSCFVIRGQLYIAKENSLYVASDNGDFPQNWPVQNVAGAFGVGTPSINGVSLGEGWAIIAGRSGAYYFDGGFPQKISEEIQPTWDLTDWEQGHLLVVQVDTEQKRCWFQMPFPRIVPPEPPEPPVIEGTPYILGQTVGTPRSDADIYAGFVFNTGTQDPVVVTTVTALGRWKIAGNGLSHLVKLFKYVDGTNDIQLGEVGVSMTIGDAGTYVYTNLATPVVLEGDTTYYVVSQEVIDGDQWYDNDSTANITAPFAATFYGAAISDGAGGSFENTAGNPAVYGPVNMLAYTT
jgi:hypothetical protein